MKRQAGFTLVETMFVMGFFSVIAVLVGFSLMDLARFTTVSSNNNDLGQTARHEVDVMMEDVNESSLVLDSYTDTNGAIYSTDFSSTLVLQVPAYDSSGNALGVNDVIIYHTVGTVPSKVLRRIVCPASGSARQAVNDQVIIRNLQSVSFSFSVDEGIIGDGVTKIFTLAGIPNTSSITVMQNGTSYSTPSNAVSFATPQTLTFNTAPAAQDALDITYSVDPSVSPSQVTAVTADINLQIAGPRLLNGQSPAQVTDISSQAVLRNH